MREPHYIREPLVYMQRFSQHKATYVEGLAELLVWIWVRTINELEESVGEVQDET